MSEQVAEHLLIQEPAESMAGAEPANSQGSIFANLVYKSQSSINSNTLLKALRLLD